MASPSRPRPPARKGPAAKGKSTPRKTTAGRAAPARKPAPRAHQKRSNQPLLDARQVLDVVGLLLLAVAAFAALALWFGVEGGAAGDAIRDVSRGLLGQLGVVVPLAIAAGGAVLLMHVLPARARGGVLGATLLLVGLLLLVSNRESAGADARAHGGFLGGHLYDAIAGVAARNHGLWVIRPWWRRIGGTCDRDGDCGSLFRLIVRYR